MLANSLRKNKINLTDYPFQKDIERRLLMAELSVFELNVLTEIIHGPLNTTIQKLSLSLDLSPSEITTALKKLQNLKLYNIHQTSVIVDKEMRKYYEAQLPKFDDDFRADMEFLHALLSKVPIHVLPQWYSIPRTSDGIFQSIIEKYLHTPSIYQRYLDELVFDEPILRQIMDDVFAAPDFKLRGKALIEKYKLTKEKFEEYMLQLEYNFVCCLSYNQRGDQWEEVVTPYTEWRAFLRRIRDHIPQPIENKEIKRFHSDDFGFIQDMNLIIEQCENGTSLNYESLKFVLKHIDPARIDTYVEEIIEELKHLRLGTLENGRVILKSVTQIWKEKHLQEQAIALYRAGYLQERNQREVEKCLKKMAIKGWVYLDDFIKACIAPVGDHSPVRLIKKGKRWKYEIPEYSSEDNTLVHQYICNNLFHAGIVALGMHEGKLCFTVTQFGKMTLE